MVRDGNGGTDWNEETDWHEGMDWNEGTEGKEEVEESWDAMVVAIGWYDNPFWPEMDGLQELRKRGLVRHAKWWWGRMAR